MQVADGVYRIDGVWGANSYLVAIDDGLMLIDTGMPGNAKRILEFVAGLGRRPADVRCIVLTHVDVDHCGSAAVMKDLTGAQVAIHELDAAVLSGESRPQKGGWPMAVVYKLSGFTPVAPDILLHDGDSIGPLRVVHTPGHTAGSVALVRDDGVVFCGDAMMADKRGHEEPPSERLSGDYPLALESAQRILEMGWTLLLPGHGAPVAGEEQR